MPAEVSEQEVALKSIAVDLTVYSVPVDVPDAKVVWLKKLLCYTFRLEVVLYSEESLEDLSTC